MVMLSRAVNIVWLESVGLCHTFALNLLLFTATYRHFHNQVMLRKLPLIFGGSGRNIIQNKPCMVGIGSFILATPKKIKIIKLHWPVGGAREQIFWFCLMQLVVQLELRWQTLRLWS